MKAVRIFEYKGLDSLVFGDFPEPGHGPDDVLVKVMATSVTPWDVLYCRGKLPPLPGRKAFPLPMQLGRDAAGVVVATGANVTRFRAGDRVVGLVHPANPQSTLSMRGFGNLAMDVDYPGHTMFGGNAQYVARPEHYWMPLADAVSFEAAAATLWSYATAHRILRDRGSVALGDTVLIAGASGGLGTATLDLAAFMGLKTVGTTRSSPKAQMLMDRWETDAIVLSGEGDAARIRALVDPLGVDLAIDYTGKVDLIRMCVEALRPGGTVVIVAVDGPGEKQLPVTTPDCLQLEINIKGARGSTLDDQRVVLALLEQGKITPSIHATVPMSEIRRAHELVQAGEVVGRLLIDPWT